MREVRDGVQARAFFGTRRVVRCTRALISVMNAIQAASTSAKVAYCGSRFVLVGTMSALASLTAFSTPPFDAGSAGWQVSTVMP